MDRYSSSSSSTLSSSAGELCSQPCDDVDSASDPLLVLATGCCVNEVVALVELPPRRWPGRKFLNSAGSSAISMRRMSDCRAERSSSRDVVLVDGMLLFAGLCDVNSEVLGFRLLDNSLSISQGFIGQ